MKTQYTENGRTITKFHGISVIHPHSGRANRSVVSRIIKHLSSGYNGEPDHQNAEYLLKYGHNTLVLEDCGKISGEMRSIWAVPEFNE